MYMARVFYSATAFILASKTSNGVAESRNHCYKTTTSWTELLAEIPCKHLSTAFDGSSSNTYASIQA